MKKFLFVAIAVAFASSAYAADAKKIERTWKSKCASCHGADGKGATEKGKKMKVSDMTAADYAKKFTDDQLKTAINDGVKKEADGVKKEMDGYKADLKDGELDGLVAHIRAFSAAPAK